MPRIIAAVAERRFRTSAGETSCRMLRFAWLKQHCSKNTKMAGAVRHRIEIRKWYLELARTFDASTSGMPSKSRLAPRLLGRARRVGHCAMPAVLRARGSVRGSATFPSLQPRRRALLGCVDLLARYKAAASQMSLQTTVCWDVGFLVYPSDRPRLVG